MQQADISKVRASVHQQCGSKVMIQLDRGRNKVDIQQGVIQHAYPSVFTILVNDERDDNQPQLLSFSYYQVMRAGSPADDSRYPVIQKGENLEEHERVKMDCPIAHLELSADFSDTKDIRMKLC